MTTILWRNILIFFIFFILFPFIYNVLVCNNFLAFSYINFFSIFFFIINHLFLDICTPTIVPFPRFWESKLVVYSRLMTNSFVRIVFIPIRKKTMIRFYSLYKSLYKVQMCIKTKEKQKKNLQKNLNIWTIWTFDNDDYELLRLWIKRRKSVVILIIISHFDTID